MSGYQTLIYITEAVFVSTENKETARANLQRYISDAFEKNGTELDANPPPPNCCIDICYLDNFAQKKPLLKYQYEL